jgi:dethiobiotin synthetase
MSQLPGFFIAGTDTEVGKTLVSGALILKLREQKVQARGFKPVAAGTYQNFEGQLVNEDLETLRIASNLSPEEFDLCPYVLHAPAAPHLAAKHEGIHLDLATMHSAYQAIAKESDCVVVEGAGGLLVPIDENSDLGNLAQQIGLPVILVVGMKLGCINHALLTVEAILARKLSIAGWIANTLNEEMSFLSENIQTLQSKIRAPFLGLIPKLPDAAQKTENAPYSLEALEFAAQHIQLPTP